jgi:hypothetical protein
MRMVLVWCALCSPHARSMLAGGGGGARERRALHPPLVAPRHWRRVSARYRCRRLRCASRAPEHPYGLFECYSNLKISTRIRGYY